MDIFLDTTGSEFNRTVGFAMSIFVNCGGGKGLLHEMGLSACGTSPIMNDKVLSLRTHSTEFE